MTSASPNIARKRLKKQETILDAALAMLSEGGLDAMTMQGLSARLDLTPGALYRYFRSKTEIMSALEARILRQMATRLQRELAEASPPKQERDAAIFRIWACADFYLRQRLEQPEQSQLIRALLGDPRRHVRDSDLPAVRLEFTNLFVQLIEELEAAARVGAIAKGDSRRRALVFWSSLHGVSSLDKLSRMYPEIFDPTAIGTDLVNTLMIGWGADAEVVREQHAHITKARQSG